MANSSSETIVCPRCMYGFRCISTHDESVCPRPECGHKWLNTGETIRISQGVIKRRAVPELLVVAGGNSARITIDPGDNTLGRDPNCDLVLDNLTVSRRHARIVQIDGVCTIEDLASSCGTLVNGAEISQRHELQPGDLIIVGGTTLKFEVRFEAVESAKPIADIKKILRRGDFTSVKFRGEDATEIRLEEPRLTFGRGADRNVIISSPLVSARHAILEETSDGHFLSDVQTATGTYVNGKPIIRSRLVSGDRIQIGPCLFRYEGDRLVRTQESHAISIEAFELTKTVGNITLLDDLTFALQAGEFVGLIGPSGAGKTTLLDALNGLRPATSGEVFLNQDPLYEEYARLRHHIGYVPQDDIIHRELTVQQALTYAAKLRLPADTSGTEVDRIVTETLDALDLVQRKQVVISQLSGGQRKRVSVGVELLSRPGVLFLDEPTSGLDPGTESRLMKLFRRLADQGRTVVCTTHVMDNIDLFHNVVILAPGGKLAWFGPPAAAKEFFGIERFTDLYDRIEELPPADWQQRFRQTKEYKLRISPILQKRRKSLNRKAQRLAASPSVSRLRQFGTLTGRFVRLLWCDKPTLAVTFAQPILITLLICVVCRDLSVILYLLIISALWFGCSSAAQQLVKERPIFRRERMVNLRLDTYLMSKVVPLLSITSIQIAIMLGLTLLLEDVDCSLSVLGISLTLAAWNGVAIGLLISALASNADKAMSVVPLSLIPQIVLAGVLVPLDDMNTPTQFASYLTAARWANQACEAAVFDGREINQNLLTSENLRPVWNLYQDQELNSDSGRASFLAEHSGKTIHRGELVQQMFVVLVASLVFFWGFTCWILKKQDTL